jgi:hypothetical protein
MQPNKKLAVWLLVNCAMIFIMVVIGAITRLTESGLSIVGLEAGARYDAAYWYGCVAGSLCQISADT